jgi:hypothetical protein
VVTHLPPEAQEQLVEIVAVAVTEEMVEVLIHLISAVQTSKLYPSNAPPIDEVNGSLVFLLAKQEIKTPLSSSTF